MEIYRGVALCIYRPRDLPRGGQGRQKETNTCYDIHPMLPILFVRLHLERWFLLMCARKRRDVWLIKSCLFPNK